MHVPDGFLSNQVAVSLDIVSGATVLYSSRRLNVESSGRIIPIMGVLAAFVFAAQLLNFPILGATSGHLIGGTLLAVVVGPLAGFLAMTTVIIAQALFLQDGGIVALGANIFNIGAVTTFVGYAVFRLIAGQAVTGKRLAISAFLAGWVSVVLSAVFCALQLGLSGVIPVRVALTAMTSYHAVIGVIEGALTAAVLSLLSQVRPDLLKAGSENRLRWPDWIGAGVLVALPCTILLLAGSSSLPDPLEKMLSIDGSESPAAPTELLSPGRYNEYIIRFGILLVLIGMAYLGSRLAKGRRSRS